MELLDAGARFVWALTTRDLSQAGLSRLGITWGSSGQEVEVRTFGELLVKWGSEMILKQQAEMVIARRRRAGWFPTETR